MPVTPFVNFTLHINSLGSFEYGPAGGKEALIPFINKEGEKFQFLRILIRLTHLLKKTMFCCRPDF